jgi:signal transduction histidine kinase/ActR/RegA family two-component response regulator
MKPRSLQRDLVVSVAALGAVAAALASVAILVHDRRVLEAHLLDRLEVQAATVGESCTAALEFGDARDAAGALGALRAATDVSSAAVYGSDGRLLASYRGPGEPLDPPREAPPLRRSIGEDGAVVTAPVRLGDEVVGTIYVRAGTEELAARARAYAAFLLAVFVALGATLGSVLLAHLRRTVTRPLGRLVALTAEVRVSGDYSRRADVGRRDELGEVADGLNRMLAAIEERDAELARQRQGLEETVARRTAELAQAQKMEAVGRLAGGIAHDFNNILAVVLADARALEGDLPEGDQRDCAAEIAKAGERGAALTRQLLAFSRKQVLHPRPVDVAATIADLSKMLGRLIGEHIRLVLDVGAGRRTVTMDPAQLEHALVNLAVNARDAMPAGGTLRIGVGEAAIDPARAARLRLAAGRYVVVEVADDGCGMTPEVMARVFEPFFTTKPQGKGTGLGLAIVYGAVEQSGGRVDVASAPNRGTTFTLYLPAHEAAVEDLHGAEAGARVPSGAGETVLLVEDDPQVRSAVRRMVEGAGYRVVEASSGEDALARLQEHAVDLVLTDLVMPGMGGLALGRDLAARGGAAPVLYMSGYSDELVAGGAAGSEHFIAKPFSRDDLLRRIRASLGPPPAGQPAPRAA